MHRPGYTHQISESVPFMRELVRPDFPKGDLHIKMRRFCLRLACSGAAVVMIGCGREENEPGAVDELKSSEVPLAAGGVFIEEGDLDPEVAMQLVDPDLKSAEEFIASIKVPVVEFSHSNLANALTKIQEAAAEHSISHQSFSVIVESGEAGVSSGNEAGSFEFEDDDSRPAFLTEETFSGVYRNVPITTLLDEICRHFSVWYQVTPSAVVIRHNSVPKPEYKIATFPLDRAFLRATASSLEDPFNPETAPVEKGDPVSAVAALEPHGIVFEGKANACFDEANKRLVVKADLREIERIAKILESFDADAKE